MFALLSMLRNVLWAEGSSVRWKHDSVRRNEGIRNGENIKGGRTGEEGQ